MGTRKFTMWMLLTWKEMQSFHPKPSFIYVVKDSTQNHETFFFSSV